MLNDWVDFVTQKTRASSQLIYNDFLGRFLFAMCIFDLSLVTLSKSTNCTLIQVWVSFFPFSGLWRRAINTCVFSNQEAIFIIVSLIGATLLFQFLTYRCINSFMADDSQSSKIRLAYRQCFEAVISLSYSLHLKMEEIHCMQQVNFFPCDLHWQGLGVEHWEKNVPSR